VSPRIAIDQRRIAAFCREWRISRLELFGSVLRDDFSPASDVDVMVSFEPDSRWSLLDLVAMKAALEVIFEREVDLLTRPAVEASRNPFRKSAILSSAQVLFAA
jgi:predicted nucleotidyltransferase